MVSGPTCPVLPLFGMNLFLHAGADVAFLLRGFAAAGLAPVAGWSDVAARLAGFFFCRVSSSSNLILSADSGSVKTSPHILAILLWFLFAFSAVSNMDLTFGPMIVCTA